MSEYIPYLYQKKTLLIEKYIILGEQSCQSTEYDLFDMTMNPFAIEKIADIQKNGYDGYMLFTEQNVEFFNSLKTILIQTIKKYFYIQKYSVKLKQK